MSKSHPKPGTLEWYAQVDEPVIDPERPIIDTHHHFWRLDDVSQWGVYGLNDLWSDTGSGHNIQKTVFVECQAQYRKDGPEHLRPVGETAYVAKLAKQSVAAQTTGKPCAVVAGIIGHADLTLGDTLADVLDAHEDAGKGLFRGIRYSGAHHPHPESAVGPGRAPVDLFHQTAFQAGVRLLGDRGYTYESWHYHTQNNDYLALAKSAPNTTIIVNHLGHPLLGGPFRDRRDKVFAEWRGGIAALAKCPNVQIKLGGMVQPDIGLDYHTAARPVTSEDLVVTQKDHYLHAIECFGPERCTFESNFPVDKLSVSYRVLWNAFKTMVADFSADDQHEMFFGTAKRIYQT